MAYDNSPDSVFLETLHVFLTDLLEVSKNSLSNAVFDGSEEGTRTLMALYATLYEHVDATLLLYEQGRISAALVVQRSALEAYVEFANLFQDLEYVKFMEASYHKEFRKLLGAALLGTNPFLASLGGHVACQATYDHSTKRIKELKDEGFEPLSVLAKFQKVRMENEYHSAYNILCSESHNNIRSLQQRHLKIIDGKPQLIIYAEEGDERTSSILDGLSGLFISATVGIHTMTNSSSLAEIKRFDERLLAIRTARENETKKEKEAEIPAPATNQPFPPVAV